MKTWLWIPLVFSATAATAQDAVYFEDQFDGDDLAMEWQVLNPNPDGYLVEAGLLTMLALDGKSVDYASADNVLRLDKPLPSGDWTITARFLLTPATMGENLRIGVAKDPENSLLASFKLESYNYSTTYAYLQSDKLSRGERTGFSRDTFEISDRDVEVRAGKFADAITAVELRLTKEGRKYTGAMRYDAAADSGVNTEWMTVQKLTSLRAPGDAFVMMFGSNSNGYTPAGGEGLVEVDWVRIEAK